MGKIKTFASSVCNPNSEVLNYIMKSLCEFDKNLTMLLAFSKLGDILKGRKM